MANGEPESYLPRTGLAVWEVVWLSRAHVGAVEALMEHFRDVPISREPMAEALT